MVERTLITTADERTWPIETTKPVLFLGEWCKRFSRKKQWEEFDSEVASYHWDDRKKLYEDYNFLKELYETLLVELSEKLNKQHTVDHSVRYWRILIGPWLGYFIQMLFDRWFMLRQVIEQSEISECNVLDRDYATVIPNDMAHFTKLFVEDDWNEAIYGQLLENIWSDKVNIIKINIEPTATKSSNKNRQGIKTALRKLLEKFLYQYSNLVAKDDDFFFISSYIPIKTELKLQLRLGQTPQVWRSLPSIVAKPDLQLRKSILITSNAATDIFYDIAMKLIPLHIPTAYLEGYDQQVSEVNTLGWPTYPKVIFTSNSYSSDDLFKTWAAEKAETGTPLFIGQHGGHFGMTPFAFHEEHQIEIADKWVSWGWTDQTKPQITPLGNLKGFGQTVGYDPTGRALMVEMAMPRNSYHLYAVPLASQWLDYFDEQVLFLSKLPSNLKKEVTLRLFPNDYGWDQEQRWKEVIPEVRLDDGHQNIRHLIAKSRLYIGTYNSTNYLETLSSNIPTIIFWNPAHWELKVDVQLCFDLLKSVGIYHETPESAAKQMTAVWDDVEEWWRSDAVQDVIVQFCEQFAKTTKDPIAGLQKIF